MGRLADEEGDFMVLGAGGKIGLHLSMMLKEALTQLGKSNRVIAVSRFYSLHGKKPFEKEGIECITADLSQSGTLESLPDCKNIFFLAGTKFGTSNNKELLYQMNVEVPRNVANRFPDARIVAFSTGCVYPFVAVNSGGSLECDPIHPQGEYAKSCVGREKVFAGLAREKGTEVCILRLNYAVDFYYGVLVDICRQVMAMEPIDLSTGHFNVIWQRDALQYTIHSLFHTSPDPFIINVTGDLCIETRAVAERFSELLGKPVSFTGQEAGTAWLSNASRCHQLWGPPETSLEEMIQWVAAWLQSGGGTYGKATGFQVRDGNF